MYGCEAPARMYVAGWRCADHAPPAQPTPPPGTTLEDLRARLLDRQAADRVRKAQEERERAQEARERRALRGY